MKPKKIIEFVVDILVAFGFRWLALTVLPIFQVTINSDIIWILTLVLSLLFAEFYNK